MRVLPPVEIYDHSIGLYGNGPRRRATCGPALQPHCCFCRTKACAGKAALRPTLSPRRIVPRHRCGQPRSPVRPTAPLINHNDRQPQVRPCGSRRRAAAPWASPRRTRRALKIRSATHRRIEIIDAFGDRRARCPAACLVGRGVRAQGPKVESTSPPSEYRSTPSRSTRRARRRTSRRRRRPPRSSSRNTSRDTKKDPGRSRPRPRPGRSRRWPRRRRRRRRHRLLTLLTRRRACYQ